MNGEVLQLHVKDGRPSGTVEENGVYAVRLPESRGIVLRRIWRMDDGLLLLGPACFDGTPRIVRPGTEGFSVICRVVEEDQLADWLY